MMAFMLPDIRVPARHDFDKDRIPFPLDIWGNDRWGNCVICGEGNHLLRVERVEQRRTLKITTDHVVNQYKSITGSQKPGDTKDNGLVVLNAMRNWKHNGFHVGKRTYSIAAYGELEPNDRAQMRMANYLLHGIHMGFWLPMAAKTMGKTWDYQGQTGDQWRPGSWGGHLVYSKAFTPEGFEILTWGKKVFVTNSFVEKYCDEAWTVVDNFNSWRVKQTVDVAKLTGQLHQISRKVDR
jgi:hypothetical protein